MFGQPNSTKLTLKEMFINNVPAFPAIARPEMTVKITPAFLQAVRDAAGSDDKLATISNAELAKLLPGIVEYSSSLVEPLMIPGGWDKRRCAFNMIYEYEGVFGMTVRYLVAGFTDARPRYDEQDVDWEGVNFYVNFISALRTNTVRTSSGNQDIHSVGSANLILGDRGQYPQFRHHRIRPSDVFIGIDSLLVAAGEHLIDTRTMVTSHPVLSKREHVVPAAWLGEILRGYGSALQMDFGVSTMDVLYSNARGVVSDQSPSQDPFMRAIAQETGYNHGAITMRGLLCLFPNLNDITLYVTHVNEEPPVYVEGKKEWHAPAMLVGLGTTGLMAATGLSVLQFSATNNVQDDEQVVVVKTAQLAFGNTMADVDVSGLVEKFKKRFIDEILPHISQNNQQSFELQVTSHFGGNTQVIIGSGRAGEEKHVRVIPSYADSLLSPLIYTQDQEDIRLQLAQDVSTILDIAQPNSPIPGAIGSL